MEDGGEPASRTW